MFDQHQGNMVILKVIAINIYFVVEMISMVGILIR